MSLDGVAKRSLVLRLQAFRANNAVKQPKHASIRQGAGNVRLDKKITDTKFER